MSSALSDSLSLIISIVRSLIEFMFETPHPGFMYITIGGVLIGLFMISFGFDLMDFFLDGKSSSHVRSGG